MGKRDSGGERGGEGARGTEDEEAQEAGRGQSGGGLGGVGASSHTRRSFTGHQSITERFKVVLVE